MWLVKQQRQFDSSIAVGMETTLNAIVRLKAIEYGSEGENHGQDNKKQV